MTGTPTLETAWVEDLEKLDALEVGMTERDGHDEPAHVAERATTTTTASPPWRPTGASNEGLFDTETSLCTAANLVFALRKYDGVADVAHTPVWGQGHVLAERAGTATSNLLDWVVTCCAS